MSESSSPMPPYHDLLVVTMGHEHPGQLGRGWLAPETMGERGCFRWTSGRADLRLNCIPAPMRLWIRAGVPIARLAKTLTVRVNGRRIWEGQLGEGFQDVSLDLPPALVPGDSMRVDLIAPGTVPARLGAGSDRRTLGVMVQRAWIEAAPAESFRPIPLRPRWRDWLPVRRTFG